MYAIRSYYVTYYISDESGNSSSTSFNVEVYAKPTVTATAQQDTTCVQSTSIGLTGAPAGGTWSGTAVTGSNFDPSSAGTGSYDLVYLITTPDGCDVTDTATVVSYNFV